MEAIVALIALWTLAAAARKRAIVARLYNGGSGAAGRRRIDP